MGSPFKITASQLSGLSPLKQDGEVGKYHYTKYKKKDAITYTTQEKKDLALDVAAMFHPGFDLAHASLKAKEGKYGEAALYAGFAAIPGAAKPLVEGTKKVLSKFKNLFTKSKNQKFNFGGGDVTKSLTAPKETKLLTGGEINKYTHMTSDTPVGGQRRNLENTLEEMMETNKPIWFSSGRTGAKHGPKRYTYTDMETGVGGKITKKTSWSKNLKKQEAANYKKFQVIEKERQEHLARFEKNFKGDWDKDGRYIYNQINDKYNDALSALWPKTTQPYHQIDVTLNPKAKIKKFQDQTTSAAGHAHHKKWTDAELEVIRKEGYDAVQLLDSKGHDIETIVLNKDIITITDIDKMGSLVE